MKTDLAPRHLQLRETLFHRWKADGLRPGDRIESQNEIARFCDFSLITVVKTLKDLEAEGIIRRQVGRGSFLERTPWTEAHHRVGFFYNRDVVGGGIFDNDFYTRLVVGLERAVVSDGHEFILGSFTNAKMPMAVWDALDVIVLTSITGDTRLDFLDTAASQISVIDQTLIHPKVHSYRLDYAQAFRDMFTYLGGASARVLYLDSEISSNEQRLRRDAITQAAAVCGPNCVLEVTKVNQEDGPNGLTAVHDALARFNPDVVVGYANSAWLPLIRAETGPETRVFTYGLDSEGPGFVVSSNDWMQSILPKIYGNLADRKAKGAVHNFDVRFVPPSSTST
ncbi:GntR family transcriptional regulator [Flavimaricola marinus]|uniref:GntR family transcriptional regulator n=1 Tax=Flavimaricola marinus TaxID=1819565 RepID=UPI001FE37B3B|nr:GntR family transcriptional regulator [Flavimaricola marinus]